MEWRRIAVLALAWLGSAAALGAAWTLLDGLDHPWLLASFGGSCAVLFAMPESDMARARSLFGGHVLSSVVGLTFLHFGGPHPAVAVAAVATAIALMMATRTVHSPAGANPLVIFAEGADWMFLVKPLAVGLVAMFAVAWIVSTIGRKGAR